MKIELRNFVTMKKRVVSRLFDTPLKTHSRLPRGSSTKCFTPSEDQCINTTIFFKNQWPQTEPRFAIFGFRVCMMCVEHASK